GMREARLAGDWLRSNAPGIDQVLCSTATRTRETLARTKINAPTRYLEALYGATPGMVIQEINSVDDEVQTLLLLGHEPTMSQLAIGLAGAGGTNQDAAEQVSVKFPTSAIAVLHTGGSWRQLEPGDAALVDFHIPR
ncbi:MAG: histidine phosphatase family protein, partial [Mycobacteriaceae bacterium]|nr:histidine phosphatase family protein [Mycobacteriaceae bacterium]